MNGETEWKPLRFKEETGVGGPPKTENNYIHGRNWEVFSGETVVLHEKLCETTRSETTCAVVRVEDASNCRLTMATETITIKYESTDRVWILNCLQTEKYAEKSRNWIQYGSLAYILSK